MSARDTLRVSSVAQRARERALEVDKRQDGLFVGSIRRDLFTNAVSEIWIEHIDAVFEEEIPKMVNLPIGVEFLVELRNKIVGT